MDHKVPPFQGIEMEGEGEGLFIGFVEKGTWDECEGSVDGTLRPQHHDSNIFLPKVRPEN
jgi:hypothetical protein